MTVWVSRDVASPAQPNRCGVWRCGVWRCGVWRCGVWRGIEDRLLARRDRLLASASFQRWAAGFPLTRRIARKRAQALFDLCAGFVYSQILSACVRLRVCEVLLERPRTPEQLAGLLAMPPDKAVRLLEAAEALRLVERRRDGRYGAGALGAALAGNPAVAAMVRHHALFYDDLRDPIGLLRGEHDRTELGQYWPYAGTARPADAGAAEVVEFSALMAASQALIAADVLAAYRFGRHRCLLDLGGGDGGFIIEAAAATPALRLMLFDLPAVADRARGRFAEAGLSGRAQAIGGDFRRDPLPPGADIVSLIRVIHDHDDAAALAILRAARRALPPGGTMLLAEPMADTSGAEPVGAYFNFYLLAMGSGRLRRAEELMPMMREAGFSRVRPVPTRRPMLVRILVGHVDHTAAADGAGAQIYVNQD
jgi:demethylspheroidene O-methyltransferase